MLLVSSSICMISFTVFTNVVERNLDDGICCTFGQGKYQLYLGRIVDQILLTTGGNFESTEISEFEIEGDVIIPPPTPMPIVSLPIDTPNVPPSNPTAIPPTNRPTVAVNTAAPFKEDVNNEEPTDSEETKDSSRSLISRPQLISSLIVILVGFRVL